MAVIKVLVLQSFFDLSVKYTGSADAAYEIAKANNRKITDDLVVGESLIIPEVPAFNKELQYYQARNLQPATGLTREDTQLVNSDFGIGLMGIEYTFIVR